MAVAKKTGNTAKTTGARTTSTAKIIRNITSVPVHMRLKHSQSDDPFRVVLQPRGLPGDVERIPNALIDTTQFQEGLDTFFEVITATEAKKIEYPRVGYQGNQPVTIIRPSDVNVRTLPDWDGKGRPPYVRPGVTTGERLVTSRTGNITGPAAVQVPGSATGPGGGDPAMKSVGEDRRAKSEDMIPDGVDTTSRKVTVTRTRG